MSTRRDGADGDLVERFVDDLSARLDGSRRAKADMLREVRHGLSDAAAGYRESGMAAAEAEAAAVAEFGRPAELAGEFQVELAARQTRFALGFFAVTGPVGETLSRIQWSNAEPVGPVASPPEYTYLLSQAVDVVGWGASLLAVVLLLAMGFGFSPLRFRTGLAQLVAWSMLAKVVLFTVAGAALMVLYGRFEPFADPFSLLVGLSHPVFAGVAVWLAWRCLRTAGHADRLAPA
ncbi:hypothetical protein LX16_4278 [Stackebrandtia albiflava]|uniref:Uncharacterized protein n=1 Tax=Stackebrandtia albiflava TaxID=406432 RepID=A0A562UYY3_9ACTN|nr:permease prefix domain 1-containing protein [Stackebrandtia albiflava]TWJ10854.1 hypothetical protein LX16_4278 [Stackebrandtia albiflava]